jgi:hypothetical protein
MSLAPSSHASRFSLEPPWATHLPTCRGIGQVGQQTPAGKEPSGAAVRLPDVAEHLQDGFGQRQDPFLVTLADDAEPHLLGIDRRDGQASTARSASRSASFSPQWNSRRCGRCRSSGSRSSRKRRSTPPARQRHLASACVFGPCFYLNSKLASADAYAPSPTKWEATAKKPPTLVMLSILLGKSAIVVMRAPADAAVGIAPRPSP